MAPWFNTTFLMHSLPSDFNSANTSFNCMAQKKRIELEYKTKIIYVCRMTLLLNELRTGTESILDYIKIIDAEKANEKKPATDWSILECMEHIFISEKVILKLLSQPELFSDAPSTGFEKFDEFKSGKYEAPERTLPTGRFSTIEEVGKAFKILRQQYEDYIIAELPNAKNETYPHPILGPITKPQWIEFVIEHGNRHLLQIVNRNL